MRVPGRITVSWIASAMVFAGTAVPATASPDVEERPIDLFYGDFDDDLLLFAGQEPTDFCTGETPTVDQLRVWHRRDGSRVLRGSEGGVPLYLYSSDLGAPEFIEQTCGALFDDDAVTVPQEPLASGHGSVAQRIVERPDGTEEHRNRVRGQVFSSDRTRSRVCGWADLVIVDGIPVGDPADFQGLRVRPLPRTS